MIDQVPIVVRKASNAALAAADDAAESCGEV